VTGKNIPQIVKKVPFLWGFLFYMALSVIFLQKHFSRLYIPIGWTLVMLILLCLPGSVLPDERQFRIPQFDKLVHIGLFGLFVFLWCLHLSNKEIPAKRLLVLYFYIFIIGAAYGIGMEFVQKYFIPRRDFEEGDIIADLIGASLAYGISNLTLVEPGRGNR
jgi:VanZ family protein